MDRTINVNGNATLEVVPDGVKLYLDVCVEDSDIAIAKNKVGLISNDLYKQLEGLGIKKESNIKNRFQISTINQSSVLKGGIINKVVSYKVSNTLIVTIDRDDELVSKIIGIIPDTNVSLSIDYFLKDTTLILDQVIDLACKDAFMKATSLAKASGIVLGEVINISYQSFGIAPRAKFEMMAYDQSSTSIQTNPEDISFNENVSITFAIK